MVKFQQNVPVKDTIPELLVIDPTRVCATEHAIIPPEITDESQTDVINIGE